MKANTLTQANLMTSTILQLCFPDKGRIELRRSVLEVNRQRSEFRQKLTILSDNEYGAVGSMHDSVRHAAQQKSTEPLPSMGADHQEVVAISHFAHSSHGIARADHR